MKKILLLVSLLLTQTLTHAACSYSRLAWQITIINGTPDTINIIQCGSDKNIDIRTSDNKKFSDVNPAPIDKLNCTYKDTKSDEVVRTLTVDFNTNCDPIVTDQLDKPYASPTAFMSPNLNFNRVNGDATLQVEFTLVDGPKILHHKTITWNNINLNLTQGQVIAHKLASQLLSTDTSSTQAAASYDGQKIVINLSSGTAAIDPY